MKKSSMLSDDINMSHVFDSDPVISEMRRRYTTEFRQLFSMGYQNYSQGEWQVARRMLACTRSLLGVEDGPSSALLKFLEAHRDQAPKGWQGVRELTAGPSPPAVGPPFQPAAPDLHPH